MVILPCAAIFLEVHTHKNSCHPCFKMRLIVRSKRKEHKQRITSAQELHEPPYRPFTPTLFICWSHSPKTTWTSSVVTDLLRLSVELMISVSLTIFLSLSIHLFSTTIRGLSIDNLSSTHQLLYALKPVKFDNGKRITPWKPMPSARMSQPDHLHLSSGKTIHRIYFSFILLKVTPHSSFLANLIPISSTLINYKYNKKTQSLQTY